MWRFEKAAVRICGYLIALNRVSTPSSLCRDETDNKWRISQIREDAQIQLALSEKRRLAVLTQHDKALQKLVGNWELIRMEFQEPVFLIIYTQNSCLLNIYNFNLKQSSLLLFFLPKFCEVSELHLYKLVIKRQFGFGNVFITMT